jgi:hypothetical protein
MQPAFLYRNVKIIKEPCKSAQVSTQPVSLLRGKGDSSSNSYASASTLDPKPPLIPRLSTFLGDLPSANVDRVLCNQRHNVSSLNLLHELHIFSKMVLQGSHHQHCSERSMDETTGISLLAGKYRIVVDLVSIVGEGREALKEDTRRDDGVSEIGHRVDTEVRAYQSKLVPVQFIEKSIFSSYLCVGLVSYPPHQASLLQPGRNPPSGCLPGDLHSVHLRFHPS